eukprot:3056257-Prymnesium_polylepis.2
MATRPTRRRGRGSRSRGRRRGASRTRRTIASTSTTLSRSSSPTCSRWPARAFCATQSCAPASPPRPDLLSAACDL